MSNADDVVRYPSVGTPVRVSSVQIGDLVGASYCKNSLRSGSAPPTNPAIRPSGFTNLLTKGHIKYGVTGIGYCQG